MSPVIRSVLVATLIVVGGCASAPAIFSSSSTTTKTRNEVFECALALANKLGYQIVEANRDLGSIRAEKRISSKIGEAFSNDIEYDQINVSIFVDEATQETTLRVMAQTIVQEASGVGAGSRTESEPTDELVVDARRVLASCSDQLQ